MVPGWHTVGLATVATLPLLLFAVYLIVPWFIQWGTQDDERRITLPGDEVVAHPHTVYTLAVTIGAAPSAIWPWLVHCLLGTHAEVPGRRDDSAAVSSTRRPTVAL